MPLTRELDSKAAGTCEQQIGGFAGWAPGAVMWDNPQDSGVAIGKGVGIVAVKVNIHYTDVVQEGIVAQDGIRVFYTPTLRNHTMMSTPVINIPTAPKDLLTLPPMKKRHFLTRECTVVDRCTDSTPEQLQALLRLAGNRGANAFQSMKVTCALVKSFGACGKSAVFMTLCPSSCDSVACPPGRDPTKEKPLAIVGTFYHAHLAGTEMYMTRTRDGAKTNLASQPIWHYDDQRNFELTTQGFDLRSGDQLQTTCVYDTTKGVGATAPLSFGKETIDEMCINTILTKHTTAEAKTMGATSFTCMGNLWMGDLATGESGIDVEINHPEAKATHVYMGSALGAGDRVANDVIAPDPVGDMNAKPDKPDKPELTDKVNEGGKGGRGLHLLFSLPLLLAATAAAAGATAIAV